MCTIHLIVFVLVISHASPPMNTAKFNIRFRPFKFPAVVDRQLMGYGGENGGQS